MLERQGIKLNAKKLHRLYKEERLTVRKRGGRKRALGTRAPMTNPQDRNLRWSLDFVADTLVSGRRFRIMTLVDDFTRECLGLVVEAVRRSSIAISQLTFNEPCDLHLNSLILANPLALHAKVVNLYQGRTCIPDATLVRADEP